MATKREIASDIELRLTRGKPSDDLELDFRQIYFWMDTALDAFIHDSIKRDIEQGLEVNPFYIKKEECKLMTEEVKDCEDCDPRFYISITKTPISLPNDRGIVRVTDTRGAILGNFSKDQIEMLHLLDMAKPTKKKQVFYRENKNLYIEKANSKQIDIVKYNVYYVPMEADAVGDDDEYPISAELLPEFILFIEGIARRQMESGFEDLQNNGKQA